MQKHYPDFAIGVGIVAINLAHCYWKTDYAEQALPLYHQAIESFHLAGQPKATMVSAKWESERGLEKAAQKFHVGTPNLVSVVVELSTECT